MIPRLFDCILYLCGQMLMRMLRKFKMVNHLDGRGHSHGANHKQDEHDFEELEASGKATLTAESVGSVENLTYHLFVSRPAGGSARGHGVHKLHWQGAGQCA